MNEKEWSRCAYHSPHGDYHRSSKLCTWHGRAPLHACSHVGRHLWAPCCSRCRQGTSAKSPLTQPQECPEAKLWPSCHLKQDCTNCLNWQLPELKDFSSSALFLQVLLLEVTSHTLSFTLSSGHQLIILTYNKITLKVVLCWNNWKSSRNLKSSKNTGLILHCVTWSEASFSSLIRSST